MKESPAAVSSDLHRLIEENRRVVRGLLAEGLAARLGRSAVEIREEGLGVGDFGGPDSGVLLTLCDGSKMTFRYAFAVVDESRGLVGVFTEHCGYHWFATVDLVLEETHRGTVVRRRVR